MADKNATNIVSLSSETKSTGKLCDPNTRPWFRRIDISACRYEASCLSDESELLYWRFLSAYTEHRCKLTGDHKALAKILNTTAQKAKVFLLESRQFISEAPDGCLMHLRSQEEFRAAVSTSEKQYRNGKKGGRPRRKPMVEAADYGMEKPMVNPVTSNK